MSDTADALWHGWQPTAAGAAARTCRASAVPHGPDWTAARCADCGQPAALIWTHDGPVWHHGTCPPPSGTPAYHAEATQDGPSWPGAPGPRVYHAEAVPDGPHIPGGLFWSVRVPAIERTTQARTLAELEPMTRDLIATMEDVPPGSFALTLTIAFPAADVKG